MSARRGWCPGVFDPMPTGDGLLVRVKPPLGMVSAAAASVLAEAALRCGNGTIEITRRGNLQVRGLSPAGVAPFAAAMIDCGLAHADADAERRRCVKVSPLIGDDPSLAPETAAIAAAIERGLIADPRFAALPAKFCIAVDGGGALPLRAGADIVVRAGDGAFAVIVGGREIAFVCDPAEIATYVTVMAGLDPAIHGFSRAEKVVDARVKPGHDGERGIGFIGYEAWLHGAFGVGIPFGMMFAATLCAIAGLSERHGDGKLRMTPWRAVVIGGVLQADALKLAESATALGLIVEPADPRLRVIACPGSPGCSSATVAARADAERIAQALPAGATTIHVSGCRKGCAHPGAAAITLVGDGGHYGIVRHGKASDVTTAAGFTIAEVIDRLAAEITP